MALQKRVKLDIAYAVQGDRASMNDINYTVVNPIAGAPITIGTFVWAKSADSNDVAAYGAAGALLGFVERWLAFPTNEVIWRRDDANTGSMVVPEGFALQVARRGDFWAVSSTAATIGQKVFANIADGTIQTADSGQTVSGAVETEYYVKSAGAAGDLIMISSY